MYFVGPGAGFWRGLLLTRGEECSLSIERVQRTRKDAIDERALVVASGRSRPGALSRLTNYSTQGFVIDTIRVLHIALAKLHNQSRKILLFLFLRRFVSSLHNKSSNAVHSHLFVLSGAYAVLRNDLIQQMAQSLALTIADSANTDTNIPDYNGSSGKVH
jgi:hypothetical protein